MSNKAELVKHLAQAIANIEAGKPSGLTPEHFSAFDPEALAVYGELTSAPIDALFAGIGQAELPVLRRAYTAAEAGEQAWIGFKLVLDAAAAVDSEDTAVAGIAGVGQGSADGEPLIFFGDSSKNILSPREFSKRDNKQMKDITAGPSMHNTQYAGLIWLSEPLEPRSRVFVFGAGDITVALANYSLDVGFEVTVLDFDPEFLSEQRFGQAERILIPSYDEIGDLGITENDLVCVLTRGHMHDPQALAYGVTSPAYYVGMIGNPNKNAKVVELALEAGVSQELLDRATHPIGFQFGGKTPPEIAISIVAQLINVRYERRKRAKGEAVAPAKGGSPSGWLPGGDSQIL